MRSAASWELTWTTVIFGKNTTEAVNKLSYRLNLPADSVVLTTVLENHSNGLPWRARAHVVHVGATPEGRLDRQDFDRKLAEHAGRLALVTVSGASNVTGFIQPVHELARKAHAHGARIMVDVASGEYFPAGYQDPFNEYLPWIGANERSAH